VFVALSRKVPAPSFVKYPLLDTTPVMSSTFPLPTVHTPAPSGGKATLAETVFVPDPALSIPPIPTLSVRPRAPPESVQPTFVNATPPTLRFTLNAGFASAAFVPNVAACVSRSLAGRAPPVQLPPVSKSVFEELLQLIALNSCAATRLVNVPFPLPSPYAPKGLPAANK
jgi:hypothetical protein